MANERFLLIDPVTGLAMEWSGTLGGETTGDVVAYQQLAAEISTRSAADSTLQSNLTAEISTRGAADSTLQGNIDAEVSTRGAADSTLQGNIDAEVSTRSAADSTLQTNLNSEISTRGAADSTLQGNINAEASTRAAVDTALGLQITAAAAGLIGRGNCDYATTAALPACAYADGPDVDIKGVDATLTGNANGLLSIDGHEVVGNQRILVKNQVNEAHNGIYVVTATGTDGVAPFILTRSPDFDGAPEGEIHRGSYVWVMDGDSQKYTSWWCISPLGGDGIMDNSEINTVNGKITWEVYAQLAAYQATGPVRITDVDGFMTIDIDAEVSTRQAADSTLQTNLNAEISTRGAADSTLQGNIDAEVSTRGAADSTLQTNLNAEISTRGAADSTLQGNIDAEVSTRSAADSTLQGNIDAEVSTRGAADSTLQGNIDAEVSTRQAADSTLQGNIDAEVSTRGAADSTLQGNINAEASTRGAVDTTLQQQIDALQTGAAVIFQSGHALAAGDIVYIGSNGKVYKADASDSAKSKVIGAVEAAVATADADAAVTLDTGIVNNGLSSLAVGGSYYLSASAPGTITTTPPTGSGNRVIFIGYALTTTSLLLQIGESKVRA